MSESRGRSSHERKSLKEAPERGSGKMRTAGVRRVLMGNRTQWGCWEVGQLRGSHADRWGVQGRSCWGEGALGAGGRGSAVSSLCPLWSKQGARLGWRSRLPADFGVKGAVLSTSPSPLRCAGWQAGLLVATAWTMRDPRGRLRLKRSCSPQAPVVPSGAASCALRGRKNLSDRNLSSEECAPVPRACPPNPCRLRSPLHAVASWLLSSTAPRHLLPSPRHTGVTLQGGPPPSSRGWLPFGATFLTFGIRPSPEHRSPGVLPHPEHHVTWVLPHLEHSLTWSTPCPDTWIRRSPHSRLLEISSSLVTGG